MVYIRKTFFEAERKACTQEPANSILTDPDLQDALLSRRTGDFYQACVRTGYMPEGDGLERELYEQGRFEHSEGSRKSRPARKINYELLGKLITGYGKINTDNVLVQIGAKRAILKRAGYTHLTGKDGERITIDSATDSRVGQAFRETVKCYKAYVRHVRQ